MKKFTKISRLQKKFPLQKKDTNISPAARKMATEANVDLNQIHGTGKNGVILKEDIMSLMGSKPLLQKKK